MKSFALLFVVHLQLEFTIERWLKAPAQLEDNHFVYESKSRKNITKIPF